MQSLNRIKALLSPVTLFWVKKASFFPTSLVIVNLYSYGTLPALSIRPGANAGRRVLLLLWITAPKAPWYGHIPAMVLTTWPACSPARPRRSRSDAAWGSPCRVSARTRLCPASTTGHVCSCYTSKSATCKTEGAWGGMLKPRTFNWAAPRCLYACIGHILLRQKVRNSKGLCSAVRRRINQHWTDMSDYHIISLQSIKKYHRFKLIASP